MVLVIFGEFSQSFDYPLLLGLDKLVNFNVGDFDRRDDLDLAGRDNNAHLLGPLATPDFVGKR